MKKDLRIIPEKGGGFTECGGVKKSDITQKDCKFYDASKYRVGNCMHQRCDFICTMPDKEGD